MDICAIFDELGILLVQLPAYHIHFSLVLEMVIPAVIFSKGVFRFGYLPFRGPRGGGGGFQQWRDAVGGCEDDSFIDG